VFTLMFVETAGVAEPVAEAQGNAGAPRQSAMVGVVATRLAEALGQGDVIYVAADEQRAEMVATALAIAAPDAEVLHCPSSDALPGDTAPASPANVGRRVAALHRARAASLAGERRTALVTTAEGAARLYPPVEAFDASLPRRPCISLSLCNGFGNASGFDKHQGEHSRRRQGSR
jgi:transcription-repair coupling factor (superfamily II helicase)